MSSVSHWPNWVQMAFLLPNVLLGYWVTYLWWPKSSGSWRRYCFVTAYLLLFYLVMYFGVRDRFD